MALINQISPYLVAAYGITSILGHVLPAQWGFTKLCLRLAANLKPATEDPKK